MFTYWSWIYFTILCDNVFKIMSFFSFILFYFIFFFFIPFHNIYIISTYVCMYVCMFFRFIFSVQMPSILFNLMQTHTQYLNCQLHIHTYISTHTFLWLYVSLPLICRFLVIYFSHIFFILFTFFSNKKIIK